MARDISTSQCAHRVPNHTTNGRLQNTIMMLIKTLHIRYSSVVATIGVIPHSTTAQVIFMVVSSLPATAILQVRLLLA